MHMRAQRLLVLGLTTVLAAALVYSSPGATRATTRVDVVMDDYSFALSKKKVRRGAAIFSVVNQGEVVHDFKIAGKKTPIYETGAGGTLKVVFKKAGRYPYICTVPGHALAGMKGVLRIV